MGNGRRLGKRHPNNGKTDDITDLYFLADAYLKPRGFAEKTFESKRSCCVRKNKKEKRKERKKEYDGVSSGSIAEWRNGRKPLIIDG